MEIRNKHIIPLTEKYNEELKKKEIKESFDS